MNIDLTDNRPVDVLMRENMLVKHLAGSHAYGTAIPTSDVDYRGVFVADPINYLTPFYKVKEVEDQTEEDTKLYELGHFVQLAVNCNPNIVETLWVDESDITFTTPAYEYLRANRSTLLSSKIAFTTSGYAMAQLKRIKGHNKWINNPQPVEAPQPKDYISVMQWFGADKNLKPNLTEYFRDHRLIPYGTNTFGIYSWPGYCLWTEDGTLLDKIGEQTREDIDDSELHPIMLVKWNRDEYKTAKEKHEQYWQWKNNRNEVRGELEEQFGYDTKHAMHLVRLMRMGEEALSQEELIVKRPDAEELLAIRNGAWTYEEILAYADDMDEKIKELYKTTNLPKKPNLKRVSRILMETQEYVWSQDSR